MRFARNAICAWLAALAICAGVARADSISVSFVGQAPLGTFNYTVSSTVGDHIQTGDYFAVIDVAGFISATPIVGFLTTTVPTGTGLAADASGSRSLPAPLNGDDGGRVNVVYEYVGVPSIPGAAFVLVPFSITSTFTTTTIESYIGRDHKAPDPSVFVNYSTGDLFVPGAVVPLPAAAWAGMALMGVIGGHKLRLSRRPQA